MSRRFPGSNPSFNIHHHFWAAKDYTTRVERDFRNFYGNKTYTPVKNHALLHARVSPPPKPSRQQMFDLVDFLEETPDAVQMERLWGLDKAAQFFGAIACQETEEAFKARRIADNIEKQMGILSLRLAGEAA